MTELTDAALVQSALREDGEAFGHLYRRFYPRLVRLIVRKTSDRALAEDVAQEALLRALDKLDTFDSSRPLWPWLKVIASNLAVDAGRKRSREVEWEPEDAAAVPAKEHPSCEDGMVLAQVLANLPDRQRVAVSLRYLQDWESAEAASFLGLSIPAFEQLLFRARKRLRLEYSRIAQGAFGILGAPGRWLREEAARLVARSHGVRRAAETASQLGPVTWAQAAAGGLALLAALPAVPVGRAADSPEVATIAAVVPGERAGAARDGSPAAAAAGAAGAGARREAREVTPPVDVQPRLAGTGGANVKRATDREHVQQPEETRLTSVAFAPGGVGKRGYAIGEPDCVLGACPPVLFATTDGGATWRRLPAQGLEGHSLLIPPGSDGTKLFTMAATGLQVSNDGGRTFATAAMTGAAPVTGSMAASPAFHRGDPSMLIGAQTLLRYDDVRGTIQPEPSTTLNGPFEPAFAPAYPEDPRFVMGGTRIDKGVLKSAVFTCTRAMCTWNTLRGGRGAPKVRLRDDYALSNVAYAFTQNRLYRSSDVWGFSPVEAPWPQEALILDVALGDAGDTIFVAVAALEKEARDGLYRSDDGGETWSRVRSRLFARGATAMAVDGDRFIVTLTRAGLACSADEGRSWSRRC